MHFFDGKGQKSELRGSRNVLTNHTKSKSCHQLFMASGVDTHTYFDGTKVISRNQAQAGRRLTCAWLKNVRSLRLVANGNYIVIWDEMIYKA